MLKKEKQEKAKQDKKPKQRQKKRKEGTPALGLSELPHAGGSSSSTEMGTMPTDARQDQAEGPSPVSSSVGNLVHYGTEGSFSPAVRHIDALVQSPRPPVQTTVPFINLGPVVDVQLGGVVSGSPPTEK